MLFPAASMGFCLLALVLSFVILSFILSYIIHCSTHNFVTFRMNMFLKELSGEMLNLLTILLVWI